MHVITWEEGRNGEKTDGWNYTIVLV